MKPYVTCLGGGWIPAGTGRPGSEKKVIPVRCMLKVLIVVLILSVTACARAGGPVVPVSPVPSTSTPALLTMPDVVGQNAAVASDELNLLGFTNIDLGTVDGRRIVVLPQNWTVKTQSAKPGERLALDAKIVLGCARIGGTRWP